MYRCLVPLFLRQRGQALPIAQRLQAAHAADRDVKVERILLLLVFVGDQGVFPALQFFVPRLFQVEFMVLLRKLVRRVSATAQGGPRSVFLRSRSARSAATADGCRSRDHGAAP